MATREMRVTVPAPPSVVFDFLSSAANVPLFAPGIDEANLLGGQDRLQGAWLGLRTASGRELRAQITHFHDNEGWTVVDERNTVSQIQVEAAPKGTWVTATLSGHWAAGTEARVFAEWERKLADLRQQLAMAAPAR